MTYNKKQKAVQLKLKSMSKEQLAPLQFKNGYDIETDPDIEKNYFPELLDLNKVVKEILHLKDSYCSVNTITDITETLQRKNRSSLDIWRHVIFFYPEVTLEEVMHQLNKLAMCHEITSFICCDIKRRVFLYHSLSNQYIGHTLSQDEYGLYFHEWKD